MARYRYMGDVNLEYGGTFYNFANWKHGYVDAVEVTDLDSACGFRGAVLIERMSIITEQREEQLVSALKVIGADFLPNGDIDDNGRVIKRRTAAHRWVIAYACQSYGYRDTDRSEVIQLERDGAMSFDGWKAERRLRANASLRNYVRKNWLRS